MSGSNGGVVQSRLVAGVLHVVVAVDQHRRRVLARRAQLADHQRRAAGRVDQLARRRRPRGRARSAHSAASRSAASLRAPAEIDGIRSQSAASWMSASSSSLT